MPTTTHPVSLLVGVLVVLTAAQVGIGLAWADAAQDGDDRRGEQIEVTGISNGAPSFTEGYERSFRRLIEEETDLDLPPNSTVVVDGNETYIVYMNATPQTARATVTGRDITNLTAETVRANESDFPFRVVMADSVAFDRSAERVDFRTFLDNATAYEYQLVRTRANYSQIVVHADGPESGPPVRLSYGLFELSVPTANPVERAATLTINASAIGFQGRAYGFGLSVLGRPLPAVTVGYRRPQFYQSGTSEVTVAVLPDEDGKVSLQYVDAEPVAPERSVDALADGSIEAGERVEFTAPAAGASISVRETLLQADGCGPDEVQTAAEGCVELTTDAVLYTGVTSTGPDDTDSVVPFVGIANHRQDVPAREFAGEYRIVGEVVSAEDLDITVPGEYAIRVESFQRRGDIDRSADIVDGGDVVATRTRRALGAYAGADAAVPRVAFAPNLDDNGTTATPTPVEATATPTNTSSPPATPTESRRDDTPATEDPDGSEADGSLGRLVLTLTVFSVVAVLRRRR